MKPIRNKVRAGHGEKTGKRAGLPADQKRFALRRERIFLVPILLQKLEAYQCVHDRAETSLRRAGCLTDLLDRFTSAPQCIENLAGHGRTDDQGWRVRETKLHQTLGSDLFFLGSFLWHG